MVSVEERMRVLNLLSEGKITSEQAADLLQAMDDGPQQQPVSPPPPPTPAQFEDAPAPDDWVAKQPARWLHVRVTDTDTGRPRVNVRIPISLVGWGLRVGRQFAPEIEGVDFNELIKAMQSGEGGSFVDVVDEEDGEHVEVFLE